MRLNASNSSALNTIMDVVLAILRRVLRCIFGPNPAAAHSVSKRVAAYAVPVVVLSVAVNVPKFLETRVVIERTHDPDTGQNVTNYSFDVTELRSVGQRVIMNMANHGARNESKSQGSQAARISIARMSSRLTFARAKSPLVG